MASITVRNLDDEVKSKLRVRAARHGRSMEEEARVILREGVERPESHRKKESLADAIRKTTEAAGGGVDLELPFRSSASSRPEGEPAAPGLGTRIHERFKALGGVDLEIPDRGDPHRPAPDLG